MFDTLRTISPRAVLRVISPLPAFLSAPPPDRNDVTVLFCVGVQKAGTSWLHQYLDAHPEAHVPPVKEMHYFDVLYDAAGKLRRDRRARRLPTTLNAWSAILVHEVISSGTRKVLGRYVFPSRAYDAALVKMHDTPSEDHALYWELLTAGAGQVRCVADITPAYAILSKEAFTDMLASFPTSRFLLILRDPVARTWSHLRMMHAKAGPDEPPVPEPEVLVDELLEGAMPHVRLRSDYCDLWARFAAAVPADRRLVLFYETLFTEAAMRRLTAFLGIGYRPPQADEAVHAGVERRLPEDARRRLRRYLDPVYAWARREFGAALPDEWSSHDALLGA